MPEHFVRSLPLPKKPLPMHVLAYFRMGEDDPGAVAGQPAREKTINRADRYHLKRYGSPTYTADAAPGSKLAVSFSGTAGEYFYRRYLHWRPGGNFIRGFDRPNRVTDSMMYVAYNGQYGDNGYGLYLSGGQLSRESAA